MADDLDAFFDDVNEAEKTALETQQDDDKDDEPPKKKAKPTLPSNAVKVVAASAQPTKPVKTYLKPSTMPEYAIPPPPPPPPPPPLPPSHGATNGSNTDNNRHHKPHFRKAAGKTWVDHTLSDWPGDDFRLFIGNLDPAVTDAQLHQFYATRYPSLNQVRIIRDAKTNLSKQYGFVSLSNALEMARAIRETNQQFVGSRPIQVKRANWKDRDRKQKTKQERRVQKQLGIK